MGGVRRVMRAKFLGKIKGEEGGAICGLFLTTEMAASVFHKV